MADVVEAGGDFLSSGCFDEALGLPRALHSPMVTATRVILTAMRKFNIEGPIIAEDHYHVPPLERVNLGEILELIRDKRYFVLHAPRQTGKTSALLALRDLLDSGAAGDFR